MLPIAEMVRSCKLRPMIIVVVGDHLQHVLVFFAEKSAEPFMVDERRSCLRRRT